VKAEKEMAASPGFRQSRVGAMGNAYDQREDGRNGGKHCQGSDPEGYTKVRAFFIFHTKLSSLM